MVGARFSLTAEALDARGRPLPGIVFAWRVLDMFFHPNTTIVASEGNGRFLADREGICWIEARFAYPGAPEGLAWWSSALAAVRIDPPKQYSFRRALTNDLPPGALALGPLDSPLAAGPSGDLRFYATLNGLTSAMLACNGGDCRLLASTGDNTSASGGLSNSISGFSANAPGDLLLLEGGSPPRLTFFPSGSARREVLSVNTPLASDLVSLGNMSLSRHALHDSGFAVVQVHYRHLVDSTPRWGLFRLRGEQVEGPVYLTENPLPSLKPPYNLGMDNAAGPDGSAWFVACSTPCTDSALFFARPGEAPRRVIGVGDELLGSTIASFAGSPAAMPNLFVAPDGAAWFGVILADRSTHLVTFSPGDAPALGQSWRFLTLEGIAGASAPTGVVVRGTHSSANRRGLYRVSNEEVQSIPLPEPGEGDSWEEILSAAVSSTGEVFANLRSARLAFAIARAGEAPGVLIRAGDTVELRARANFISLLAQNAPGPPHLSAGSLPGSIFRLGPGGLEPRLVRGSRYLANRVFPGATSSADVRPGPAGDLYFSYLGAGVARLSAGGEVSVALPFPFEDGAGARIGYVNVFHVNNRGDLLWHAAGGIVTGEQRLGLFRDGSHTLLATNSASPAAVTRLPSGGEVIGFNRLVLDDAGRVLADLVVRGGPSGYYVWDRGQWSSAFTGPRQVGGLLATGVHATLAQGQRLLGLLIFANGSIAWYEYRDGDWAPFVDVTEKLPNGSYPLRQLMGDLNRNSDIAVLIQGANPVIAVRRGKDWKHVYSFRTPTDDGDYLESIISLSLQEDGTLWVLAKNLLDELALYRGAPLTP
jgi:hypothetical protein